MKISIIIPTHNDERTIYLNLEDLFSRHSAHEIIVVDGSSSDHTALIASEWIQVLVTPHNRAHQMNRGTQKATGDVFLFLNGDTRLPSKGLAKIQDAIHSGAQAGRFRMSFNDRHWLLRFYSQFTKWPFFSYGGQGFFVRRELFETLGGFREDVKFEDIDFYKRLSLFTKPMILQDSVVASGRPFLSFKCLQRSMLNLAWNLTRSLSSRFKRNKTYPDIR